MFVIFSRSLFKSILALVSLLSIKLNSGDESKKLHGIGDFILLVVQSLSRVGSTSYYDLPVLEITLDCLSHITYRKGWSLQFAGSGEELCNLMADLFIQVNIDDCEYNVLTDVETLVNEAHFTYNERFVSGTL